MPIEHLTNSNAHRVQCALMSIIYSPCTLLLFRNFFIYFRFRHRTESMHIWPCEKRRRTKKKKWRVSKIPLRSIDQERTNGQSKCREKLTKKNYFFMSVVRQSSRIRCTNLPFFSVCLSSLLQPEKGKNIRPFPCCSISITNLSFFSK